MNKMKPSQFDHVVNFFFFAAVPLMVGAMILFTLWMGMKFGADFEKRAQFGDQFGAMNTLFTGVAFLGLVLTTGLQAKATREQNRAFAEQQKAQEEANRLSRLSLGMEVRRMEMDLALRRVDGAATEAEREARLREVEVIVAKAAGAVKEHRTSDAQH
ncbi:MAG: hypothetical protein EOP88_10340 [Verrucomicrobiaceae bacterium]|nr:MAG: hypothetical protein EOP88_10340 [Verrucomicrobiaceae bacterium]